MNDEDAKELIEQIAKFRRDWLEVVPQYLPAMVNKLESIAISLDSIARMMSHTGDSGTTPWC